MRRPSIVPARAVARGAARRRPRSRRSAPAAPRRRRARVSPRRASGGAAGSCSPAHRGRATVPCASARICASTWRGSPGTARRRRRRRRSTSGPCRCAASKARRSPGAVGDELHPLAAATGGGLDDQGVPDLVPELDDPLHRADGIGGSGDDRDPRRRASRPGPPSSSPSARSRPAAGRSTSGPPPRRLARRPRSRPGTRSRGAPPRAPARSASRRSRPPRR